MQLSKCNVPHFPTVCKRKFRFCKKMREKRSHFPGKNPAVRKKAPASPDGMPVRELRCQLVSVGGAGAVSYTHLDVYKRQIQHLRYGGAEQIADAGHRPLPRHDDVAAEPVHQPRHRPQGEIHCQQGYHLSLIHISSPLPVR